MNGPTHQMRFVPVGLHTENIHVHKEPSGVCVRFLRVVAGSKTPHGVRRCRLREKRPGVVSCAVFALMNLRWS